MKTEIINGVKVRVIENEQDLLEHIKTVPMTFNIKCDDKIITSVTGFDSC
jgi:hypothetical protein